MAQDKDLKTPNVPPLRFPGFTEEWKRVKVSDLLDFYSTNSLSWDMLNYDGGEIKNLHYGLIHSGVPTLVDVNKDSLPFVNEASIPKKYTLCKEGDVAFADASEDTNEVGKVVEFLNTNGENIISGLHTIHGRDKSDMTVTGFKGYAFSSMPFHHQIRRIAQGTKIYSISTKTFDEVYIGVPTKDEQAKIARLLQLLDERIAVQYKIIYNLKRLKSAIIDAHFKMSDMTVKLGDFIVEVSNRNKVSEDLPVLSVSNRMGFIAQSEQFGDRIIASEDTSNYKIVAINDFAYNPARINVRSIARLKNFNQGIVSPMYLCFRCTSGILPEYLEVFFQSNLFQTEVEKRLEGSVRLCLSLDGIKSISLPIPTKTDQRTIANRINTIQAKIALEERVFLQYKKQRQFLLTQMFI